MKHAILALGFFFFSSCSSLLYYPTHELHFPPQRFGLEPEEVHFASADGTKLFGWLLHHPGGGKPKAVFLFYHGNGENLSSHYVSLMWALKQGYDYFIFDYRGYGRSEGEPGPKGTVADGEAAMRWLRARYPDTALVVYGESLGSAVALRNAIDLKDEIRYRAVVVNSGFASYQRVARRILARGILTWPFQWVPWLVFSDHYAPDGEIGKIAPVPMLVMHAEDDPTVPFRCGEEIFGQAGPPKDFWKVSGNGHADAFLRHGDEFQKKLLAWLDKVLISR